jgi:WD40 repeat protein
LWDILIGEQHMQSLQGHTDCVTSVAFSPDGQILASGSEDGTVILWDTATNQPIGIPFHQTDSNLGITSIAFSPDGRFLASSDYDGIIVVWDVSFRDQNRACNIANRNFTAEEWQRYLGDRPYELTCPDLPPHPSAVEAGMWDEGANQE